MPRLSILLSAFNAASFIEEAIESIVNQSFDDFELLIADDGSEDGTKQIIDSIRDERLIRNHNEQNAGKTATINKLFGLARGEYLTIHDADDRSDVDRFRLQIEFLDDNQDFGMCGTSFNYIFHKTGKIFKTELMPTDYSLILDKIQSGCQFHGPTMVFRKSLITGDQLLRPYFEDYHEDCDLAYRLVQKAKATNLRQVLYHYQLVPGSLSKQLSPRKKVIYNIVSLLAKQRDERGYDDLDVGDTGLLNQKLLMLQRQYLDDPSRIFIENTEFQMYFEMYWPAIKNAWKAVVATPSGKTLRTLLYCIRKYFISYVQ